MSINRQTIISKDMNKLEPSSQFIKKLQVQYPQPPNPCHLASYRQELYHHLGIIGSVLTAFSMVGGVYTGIPNSPMLYLTGFTSLLLWKLTEPQPFSIAPYPHKARFLALTSPLYAHLNHCYEQDRETIIRLQSLAPVDEVPELKREIERCRKRLENYHRQLEQSFEPTQREIKERKSAIKKALAVEKQHRAPMMWRR